MSEFCRRSPVMRNVEEPRLRRRGKETMGIELSCAFPHIRCHSLYKDRRAAVGSGCLTRNLAGCIRVSLPECNASTIMMYHGCYQGAWAHQGEAYTSHTSLEAVRWVIENIGIDGLIIFTSSRNKQNKNSTLPYIYTAAHPKQPQPGIHPSVNHCPI